MDGPRLEKNRLDVLRHHVREATVVFENPIRHLHQVDITRTVRRRQCLDCLGTLPGQYSTPQLSNPRAPSCRYCRVETPLRGQLFNDKSSLFSSFNHVYMLHIVSKSYRVSIFFLGRSISTTAV